MDLRQFTTTPNNFERERRPSTSSMSSAQSGYSFAGNQPTPGRGFGGQSRYFGQTQTQGQGQAQGQVHAHQQAWYQQGGSLNVTPWIEQQQQVSQSSTTSSIENQNFVNSYGSNLNGPGYIGQYQQPQLSGGHSQSVQASFDPQSQRPSPSVSSVVPHSVTGLNQTNNKADSESGKNEINNESNDNDANANNNTDDDDELIPTAIVIKNIPFAIKKEQLLEVMTKLNLPLPYAFNYHFDNGVFRGLAFANFTSTDETTTVVTQLNGREIGGRKLRVEYKKMLPLAERERIEREKREKRGQLEEQHRSNSSASLASMISISSAPAGQQKDILPQQASQQVGVASQGQQQQQTYPQQLTQQPLQEQHTGSERYYAPIPFVNNLPLPPSQVDFNDPETLEFYSQLLFFKDGERQYNEIAYPATLSPNHKRIVTILVQFLGLVESYENNFILIKRRGTIHDPSPLLRSQSHSAIPLLSQQQAAAAAAAQQNQRFRQTAMPQQGASRIPPNFNLGVS